MSRPPTADTVLEALTRHHKQTNLWASAKYLAEQNGWTDIEVSACMGLLADRGKVVRLRGGIYSLPEPKPTLAPLTVLKPRPTFSRPEAAPKEPEPPLIDPTVPLDEPEPFDAQMPPVSTQRRHEYFRYPPDEEFAALTERAYRDNPDDPYGELRQLLGGVTAGDLTTNTLKNKVTTTFGRIGRERPLSNRGGGKVMQVLAARRELVIGPVCVTCQDTGMVGGADSGELCMCPFGEGVRRKVMETEGGAYMAGEWPMARGPLSRDAPVSTKEIVDALESVGAIEPDSLPPAIEDPMHRYRTWQDSQKLPVRKVLAALMAADLTDEELRVAIRKVVA